MKLNKDQDGNRNTKRNNCFNGNIEPDWIIPLKSTMVLNLNKITDSNSNDFCINLVDSNIDIE